MPMLTVAWYGNDVRRRSMTNPTTWLPSTESPLVTLCWDRAGIAQIDPRRRARTSRRYCA